jgi:hypothetical protein
MLLFGAEFNRIYSMLFGLRAQPNVYTEALTTAFTITRIGTHIEEIKPFHQYECFNL